ncbi:MAG TPA: trypsin-like peptidase domain-containing protein [Solirubrobacteraceae bacterium]|nr:trypsin-like peptidase domain-containing protein [Solirubrobacteraceae bacterium]
MSAAPFTHPRHELPTGGGARLFLVAAVVALAAVAGVVAALVAGIVHMGSATTTTVVQSAPATASVPSSPTGPWKAVYAQAAAGTVDLTVQMTETVNTPLGRTPEAVTALGSGFVLDGRGDLLTAAHVVDGASSIRVTFQDGSTRTATLLGEDEAADVAVLHVDPTGIALHPLALGSLSGLAVGDSLAVIGDPLGFDRSLSTGVVSALDRTIQAPNGFEIAHAIQTDAAMNPGNSGGPIFDSTGRVIGIADQIATGSNQFGGSSSDTSTGVGFAVPIDLIKGELTSLEHGQHVSHPYLGIATAETSGGSPGALVASVQAGGPAAKAALRAGDVIVAFNGVTITGEADLIAALAAAHPGQHVTLTIRRGSSRITVGVTLGSQPTRAPSS